MTQVRRICADYPRKPAASVASAILSYSRLRTTISAPATSVTAATANNTT